MKEEITIHTCDRCKKKITDGYISRVGRKISYFIVGYMQEREICRECRDEFNTWWACQNFPTQGAEKTKGVK